VSRENGVGLHFGVCFIIDFLLAFLVVQIYGKTMAYRVWRCFISCNVTWQWTEKHRHRWLGSTLISRNIGKNMWTI